jgi:ParB family chromosome partitioning protein
MWLILKSAQPCANSGKSTDADLLRWIQEVDKRKRPGERTDLVPDGARSGRSSEDTAAVEYAIHCQRDRRNLSDADLLRWIQEVDKRKAEGRPKKTAQPCAVSGPTSKQTAKVVGTSARKVEQARTIIDQADEDTKAESAKNARESKGSVAQPCATTKRSSDTTAAVVGTSRGKVEKARAVIDQADEMSISQFAKCQVSKLDTC